MHSWTINELLAWTTDYFNSKKIREARMEAEVLLARVLGKDRVYLYTHYDAPVNQHERAMFREYVKRRAQNEPLAYITGTREFMSLEFKVNPDVLIPRPETELIVEEVIELFAGKTCSICDIGTGSGAIAISLAHYLPQAKVFASDISAMALATARDNAARLQAKVEFREGDLLSPFLDIIHEFDLIVANLPYISADEYCCLDPGVKDYEPALALMAPGDGLDIYRRLVGQAHQLAQEGTYIILEIGYNQGQSALQMMSEWENVKLINDLAGRTRLIQARKERPSENKVLEN
ncbi:MAG: peptide chain release factor N(5)-glutamine methyltransferase [Syntrophomonadaceae bacterium]